MKYLIIYAIFAFLVSCADDTGDEQHSASQRIARAIFWPVTLRSWFISQNGRLHRLLTIMWIVLIGGWFASLLSDRLHI